MWTVSQIRKSGLKNEIVTTFHKKNISSIDMGTAPSENREIFSCGFFALIVHGSMCPNDRCPKLMGR